MPASRSRVTKWKVSKLREHPQQAAMFGDISDEELAALGEDLKKHGLRDPLEILPDGTVICGHQRLRAAKLLGWQEIEVIIRHDLAEQGDAAVESYFISDNLVRRHLSPLARARCISRLMEVESGSRSGGLDWQKKEELKGKIGAQLHLSPRSVSRYLLILRTPAAVQQAFDRGDVTLIAAGKVALLDKDQQNKIAGRIKGGANAAKVVKEHLAKAGSSNGDEVARCFVRLLGALQREAPQLKGRSQEIKPGRLKKSLEALKEAHGVLNELIEEGESVESWS